MTVLAGVRDPADAPEVTAMVARLAEAFENRDAAAFADLFREEEGAWRDVLAFTWHLRTVIGPAAIEQSIAATIAEVQPAGLRLHGETPIRTVDRAGRTVTEVFMEFETAVGPCRAIARLLDTDGELKIWSLATNLEEIRGHEEKRKSVEADTSDRDGFGGDNWLDRRTASVEFQDRDPDVLVVGAGQNGLAMAARLGQLGLDTLVVDTHPRVGDCWRTRYHTLMLHNRTRTAHFPYMPFPETFPVWLSKDKLGNWMESYADAMELNVWTSTRFEGGSFDEVSGRWHAVVQREGTRTEIRPTHIVMATGVSTKPFVPDLPGLNDFAGQAMHASAYSRGSDWASKNAIIIGIGNSAHDIAQDLHCAGAADVTMFQRGPTTVVSVESGNIVYALYDEGLPFELCDLMITATPYPGIVEGFQAVVEHCEVADAELNRGLAEAGMKLDWGYDRTGFQMKYFRRGGGYYLNVGCSDLIINGDVKLHDFADFDQIVPEGVRLTDGTVLPADLLVMATGYGSQQDQVRQMFGDDVADRIGPIWGWDDEGELSNMFKRTNQKNLWFQAGSLTQSRVMSKFVAMQIKARELGLIGAEPPARHEAPVPTAAS